MDEVVQEEKKLENEGEKSNNEIQNPELNEENKEKQEGENEINNINKENSEIMNDKIDSNLSEINKKNEENDSLLQKEINEININEISDKEKNEESENNKINKKTKKSNKSPVKKANKIKRSKETKKESLNSNLEEIIYSHNRFHNENILNYIKQKEYKEISECSFKPKINKKIGFEVTKLDNKEEKIESSSQNKNVVERLLLWKERVNQKLNNIKDKKEKEESERDKCTFFPKLKSDIPKFDKKEISGTEKYYNRIKNSREIKKQKDRKLNPDYDELYNKYYKNKEKTVLKNNKKVSKKTYENYLNHFHNVLMKDDE